MRRLLPTPGPFDTSELVALYDWPERYWVRACMVHTADAAHVGPDGLSKSISSDVDRAVFNACRAMADAYVAGAQTVRAERYRPARVDEQRRDQRLALGQSAAPRLTIVTASCRLDWSHPSFAGSEEPPLVVTVARSNAALRDAARAAGCEVAVVGEDWVDPLGLLAELAERGLTRITCEGGPILLRELIRSGVVDELDLTLSPMLTAAPAPQRSGAGVQTRMALTDLLEDHGFLFARYVRS